MSDHPSREDLAAISRGELGSKAAKAALSHLLEGCAECRSAISPPLSDWLELERPIPIPEHDYDAAINRAFAEAAQHAPHVRDQRQQAVKALAELEAGGAQATSKVASKTRGFALVEALLARSWALRHENPGEMVHYAWLAVKAASTLSIKDYGPALVNDFQCRAWSELGNAQRVADDLASAHSSFEKATNLFQRGTRDQSLGIRLLELEASLAADQRRFKLARKHLSLVHRYYQSIGANHLAGRALISKGLYTGYSGNIPQALALLKRGMALLDDDKDQELAFAAAHNQLLFLIEDGQYREARKCRFLNRRHLDRASGRLNLLRIRWVDARIDARLGELDRAKQGLIEVKEGFEAAGRGYDSALTSLDLAAILLSQGEAHDAKDLVFKAAKVFAALSIGREAIGAVLMLQQAFEMEAATVSFVEEVTAFLRKAEHDPSARFDPE